MDSPHARLSRVPGWIAGSRQRKHVPPRCAALEIPVTKRIQMLPARDARFLYKTLAPRAPERRCENESAEHVFPSLRREHTLCTLLQGSAPRGYTIRSITGARETHNVLESTRTLFCACIENNVCAFLGRAKVFTTIRNTHIFLRTRRKCSRVLRARTTQNIRCARD